MTRILIEHENWRVLDNRARDLQEAGFAVDVCAGPRVQDDGVCPMVAEGRCELAERADIVLAGLPLDAITVYIALREHLDRPVVLSLSEAELARYPVLGQIGPVVPRHLSGEELAAELDALV